MASPIARKVSAGVAARQSIIPLMPHIAQSMHQKRAAAEALTWWTVQAGACAGFCWNQLKQMAGASQNARQAPALRQAESQTAQHVAGIEEPHLFVVHDREAVVAKIPPPPIRMEQPSFGNDIAARAMPPRKAPAGDAACGQIPGFAEAPDFSVARQSMWDELRQEGGKIEERIRIGRDRRPKPPRMRRQNVETHAAGREHPPDLDMQRREVIHMLQDVRRKDDVDARVGERNGPPVIFDDWK